MKLFLLNTIEN
jgi:hypothetical protein